jgi:cobalt-zinc-cadmium efflux system outer membrane protein
MSSAKSKIVRVIAYAIRIACCMLLLSAPYSMAAENSAKPKPIVVSNSDPGMVTSPPITKSFSLSTCFNFADEHNRDIAVAKHNLAIAKAGIRIAGAIPNPQLQVQTGFGNSFLFLFTGQTQQAFLTQQLLTAGKRTKKIAVARANYQITELQLAALRFDVHNRVRRAYAELAAAEAYEALIEDQREVAAKFLRIAKVKSEASKDDSDLLQANLNVDQFDPQRNMSQGRLQQASTNLSLVTGVKPERVEIIDVDDNGLFKLSLQGTEIVPSPILQMPPLEQLIRTAFSARLDLKMALERVSMNRKAVALARAERVPDVSIGSGFTFASFAKNQPVGLANASNYFGEGAFFTMTTEAPVFYQHQGEIQQTLGTLRQSERQVELLKSQTAASTVADYNAVKVAKANLILYKEQLISTSASLAKLALDGYQAGTTDLSTALVAQQQYQQTLSSYFDTVVSYQTAWADLERDVGLPLQK